MRADIVPGAVFPDYELSDHAATRRKLSFLQGQHPMVLVLSRGGFCPKDRRQAELLVQLHRELEVSYCRLVTITTDSVSETNEYRTGVGAHWPFLSDAGRTVQKDLDIAEYTDPVHNPMIPHTIVLDPGWWFSKFTTVIGSLAVPRWRSYARIFGLSPRRAAQIRISRTQSIRLPGPAGRKMASIRTGRAMRQCLANRIEIEPPESCFAILLRSSL